MPYPQFRGQTRIRPSAQSEIFQLIYHQGPIKRADIAEQLALALPTITTNVNAMIQAGLVEEVSQESTQYVGRRARLVDVVAASQHFVGVEMHDHRRTVCVMDFRGNVLSSRQDLTLCPDYDECMDRSCTMLLHALKDCGIPLEQVTGIGFCLPGLINSQTGTLVRWPRCGWNNRAIRRDVARLTGYTGPIRVDNDACSRGYGAYLTQRERLRDIRSFGYLYISQGIACPLFMESRGSFGSVVGAGEIGHMILDPKGPLCVCGNRGCLETYASDTAILKACRQAMKTGGASILRDICGGEARLEMGKVLIAQTAGDPQVRKILENAIFRMGIAIANLINFSCPQVLFIDSALFGPKKNRDQLLEIVRGHLCNVIHMDTEYIFIEPDDYSGARGAACLAICKNLEMYGV